MPTGWTTIEEVIRFMIHDLGVDPPCGDEWSTVLAESERAFYEDFTGKRYRSGDAGEGTPEQSGKQKSGRR